MERRFTMIDEGFVCENCKAACEPLKYTARDHCPKCLYSIHVDKNPGDRLEQCHGFLIPIGIEKFKESFKIIYKCEKCNKVKKNIMAKDDNFDIILKLSSNA